MADSTRRRRTSIGLLFWIAFILLVLVIFLANRQNIEQVLETTGIVDVIRDRVTRDDDPVQPVAEDNPANPQPVVQEPSPEVVVQTAPAQETDAPAAEPTLVQEPVVAPESAPQTAPLPNRRMAALYFIRVSDDGKTFAHRVVRPVDYDQSPLTETIRALIAGPTGDELDAGLLNLIPAQTQLISAHVSDGVAYLNFNQSFRFNPMGAEGTVAQLQQIIFSSTEFPTVDRVQFLIEGEKLDYMGGDGIFVGAPLGRDAFSS